MMINKYNRVFFSPVEEVDVGHNPISFQPEADTGGTFTPIRTTITKKKRNLVALSTPLIIKLTPYEKEKTYEDHGEQITKTVTYDKTNKSFNQILDAYLMDRTIKTYSEIEQEALTPNENLTNIHIATILGNVEFYKNIINKKTFYSIKLDGITSFYATSPDTYMTTEKLVPKDENNEGSSEKPQPIDQEAPSIRV